MSRAAYESTANATLPVNVLCISDVALPLPFSLSSLACEKLLQGASVIEQSCSLPKLPELRQLPSVSDGHLETEVSRLNRYGPRGWIESQSAGMSEGQQPSRPRISLPSFRDVRIHLQLPHLNA